MKPSQRASLGFMARVILLLGTGSVWLTLVNFRSIWISPLCGQNPEECSLERLWPLDRLGYSWMNAYSRADELSYWTQNFSGIFVLGVAWITTQGEMTRRKLWLYAALMGTLVNGVVTEMIRLISQRPRPFVYQSPLIEGWEPAHYTSFISGHTSFATLACTLAVWISLREGRFLRVVFPVAIALPLITAICRVLAGRHFITDTMGGACVGVSVAWVIAAWLGPQSRIGSGPADAKKLPSDHLPDRLH